MQSSAPPLLPIFRSQLQGDLLATVLGQPDRGFTVQELARLTEADTSTVSRELSRLVRAGLFSEQRVGRTRVIQAEKRSPVFSELSALVAKAFGPGRVAAAALLELPGVTRVIVFGSWAARATGESGAAPRDLDVLLVGRPSRITANRAADELTERLGLPVHLAFATDDEWESENGGLIKEIRRRPHQEYSSQEA